MKKNRLLMILLLLFAFLLVILYFVFRDTTERKTIEINFITDHPMATSGSKLPEEMRVFCSVFDVEDQKMILFPRLSFQRLDEAPRVDTLQFSKPITADLSREDANLIYANETNTMMASVPMYKERTGNEPRDYHVFTEKFCHFFLVAKSDSRVDGKLYFDNAVMLRNYITEQLKAGTLFASSQEQNIVNIIVLSGETNVIAENPKGPEKQVDPKEREDPQNPAGRPGVFPAKLRASGNNFSWSKDLSSADRLTIVFKSKVDGKVLVEEDVTGLTSYYFSYSNSNYEASPIEVKLISSWGNGSKMTGGSLITSDLQCH